MLQAILIATVHIALLIASRIVVIYNLLQNIIIGYNDTDAGHFYELISRNVVALSVRVIVFSARAAEVTRFARMRANAHPRAHQTGFIRGRTGRADTGGVQRGRDAATGKPEWYVRWSGYAKGGGK